MVIKETNDFALIAELNEHVHTLHVELYPRYFKPYDYQQVKSFFENMINNPRFIFFVVEVDGKARGYAWVEIRAYPENPFKKSYTSIYVHQISVEERYRNIGCGQRLMKAVEGLAETHQATEIELDYWIDNLEAKQFYEKNGFVKYRECVHKYV
ncbi:GNAT family N-acetyltransferase [Halobacillus sp. BBL2006]|uniref:GNAT family N-acetyltransferase n=1 Tax=Halobacillus sp. BBL2006 TaxID=1543706 RepID=UPI0005425548|nr:GNAT family N-acetyltransferase [Halobacillus sp. BBL2006]KHE71873.1 GNAT family acetyltransferase [Halobacillus sp. BBL2006]